MTYCWFIAFPHVEHATTGKSPGRKVVALPILPAMGVVPDLQIYDVTLQTAFGSNLMSQMSCSLATYTKSTKGGN